jgi:hypothetical protein
VSEQEFVLAIVALVGTFSVFWGLGYAVFTWLRERRGPALGAKSLDELREQITEIQTSVDAIAVEVERISEGQRFATRLMAERAEPARLDRGEREP